MMRRITKRATQNYTVAALRHANMIERMFPRMMEQLFPNVEAVIPHGDIRVSQIRTLSYLLEHDGCTMGELGKALNLACSSVTGSVERIVKAGLVARFSNPGDRRQVRIRLTPKGKKSIQKFILFRQQSIAVKLKTLSAKQQKSLVKSFQSINRILSRAVMNNRLAMVIITALMFLTGLLRAEVFYDLPLSKQAAFQHNYALRQKEQGIIEARSKLTESKVSFFPQFSLNTTLTKLQEARSSSFGGVKVLFSSDVQILSRLSLSQPLYTTGKLESAKNLTEKYYLVSQFELQRLRNDLAFQIEDVYYCVLQGERLLQVAQSAVISASKHFEIAESLKQQGVFSKYDVLRAKVALTSAQQKLIQAENNFNTQKAAFRFFIGSDLQEEFRLKDVELNVDITSLMPSFSPEETALYALEHRPEILLAKLKLEIEKETRRLEEKGGLPELYFSANYDVSRGERIPIRWRDLYSLDLTLSMKLYDSGIKNSRISQSTARVKSAEDALMDLKRKVALEVGNGFLMLKESVSRLENSRAGLEEAKLGLSLAEERYEHGISTLVEVLDAQAAFESAQSDFYTSVYDFYRALAQLDKAMGRED